ncbi:MAG: MBL fold metallo-hydrolase [Alistipes ihumii]
MIDCGEGTQTRLFRCGISPLRLGTVFLTHLHGDHVYGLFGLMSTLGLLAGARHENFAPRPFDRILASHLSFSTRSCLMKYSGKKSTPGRTDCCTKTKRWRYGRSRCVTACRRPDSCSAKRPRP